MLTLVAVSSSAPGEAQAQSGLRIVTRDATRTLAIVSANNQDYVALDEVAAAFGLTLREDRLAGGITATAGSRSIIITPDQPVVSVAGRLVSLTTAPVRQGNRWLVPLDFLQRAAGPILDTRVELRRASRLVVVGDVRIPRVTARVEPSPAGTTRDLRHHARDAAARGARLGPSDRDVRCRRARFGAAGTFRRRSFSRPCRRATRRRASASCPGPKFGVHRATTSQPDATSSRLTVELLPAGAEPPARPHAAAPPLPAPAAPADPPPAIRCRRTGMRTDRHRLRVTAATNPARAVRTARWRKTSRSRWHAACAR